jgi:hypothetical protein
MRGRIKIAPDFDETPDAVVTVMEADVEQR